MVFTHTPTYTRTDVSCSLRRQETRNMWRMWNLVDPANSRHILVGGDHTAVISIGSAALKVVDFVATYEGTCLFHRHVMPHVADDGLYDRGMLTTLTVYKKP